MLSRKSTFPARRGYSLFEVIIVMMIIAIIARIAIPRYGASVAKYRADAAARRITGDLQLAQATARMIGKSCNVSFSSAADSYTITNVAGLDNSAGTYTVLLARAPYCANVSTVSFNLSAQSFNYDAYGNSDASGSVILTVGGESRTISLYSPTGQVTWQ
jgi:prepilin-type N-terminal cleavage/methylation domain-containing protein